jgi:hypothetical protein
MQGSHESIILKIVFPCNRPVKKYRWCSKKSGYLTYKNIEPILVAGVSNQGRITTSPIVHKGMVI